MPDGRRHELGVLVVGAPGECAYVLDAIERAAHRRSVSAVDAASWACADMCRLALIDFDVGEWVALRWVRAIREATSRARVVALVGYWDEREYVARRHADGIVRKPLTARALGHWLSCDTCPGRCACRVRFAEAYTEAPDMAFAWTP